MALYNTAIVWNWVKMGMTMMNMKAAEQSNMMMGNMNASINQGTMNNNGMNTGQ